MLEVLLSALIISAVYRIATDPDTERSSDIPMFRKREREEFEKFENEEFEDEESEEFEEFEDEESENEESSSRIKIPSLDEFDDEKTSFFFRNRK